MADENRGTGKGTLGEVEVIGPKHEGTHRGGDPGTGTRPPRIEGSQVRDDEGPGPEGGPGPVYPGTLRDIQRK